MGIYNYFATDKYAVYIWGSYGVTFVLLAAELLMLLKRKRTLKRRVGPEFETRDSSFNTSFQESQ